MTPLFGKHLYTKSMRPLIRFGLWSALLGIALLVFFSQNFHFSVPKISKNALKDYIIFSPHFYSVDPQGRPYKIQAEYTVQDAPKHYRFVQPIAYLEKLDGEVLEIMSPRGRYEQTSHMLYLDDQVTASNLQDYQVITADAVVNLGNKTAFGKQPIRGTGPFGHFQGTGFFFEKDHLTVMGPVRAVLKEHAFHKDSLAQSKR